MSDSDSDSIYSILSQDVDNEHKSIPESEIYKIIVSVIFDICSDDEIRTGSTLYKEIKKQLIDQSIEKISDRIYKISEEGLSDYMKWTDFYYICSKIVNIKIFKDMVIQHNEFENECYSRKCLNIQDYNLTFNITPFLILSNCAYRIIYSEENNAYLLYQFIELISKFKDQLEYVLSDIYLGLLQLTYFSNYGIGLGTSEEEDFDTDYDKYKNRKYRKKALSEIKERGYDKDPELLNILTNIENIREAKFDKKYIIDEELKSKPSEYLYALAAVTQLSDWLLESKKISSDFIKTINNIWWKQDEYEKLDKIKLNAIIISHYSPKIMDSIIDQSYSNFGDCCIYILLIDMCKPYKPKRVCPQ